jgi:uroporphyrinogen-III synthase
VAFPRRCLTVNDIDQCDHTVGKVPCRHRHRLFTITAHGAATVVARVVAESRAGNDPEIPCRHNGPMDSLDGYTVAITADRRWEEQAELLGRRGASIVHGPSIKTLPLGDAQPLRDVTQRVIEDPPDVVIANTGIGVRAWFAAADSWGLGEALVGALAESRLVARGPKASAALHTAGLEVAERAVSERLDEVVDMILARPVDGITVAFQMHGEPTPEATRRLVDAGANIIEIPVYSWRLPDDVGPALRLIDLVISRRVHAVTFTSAPAVRNLFLIGAEHSLDGELSQALSGPVAAVSVGPVCSEALIESGVTEIVQPERFRLGPMVRALTEHLESRTATLSWLDRKVRVGGRVVIDGDERIELSETEAAVLGHLLSRLGSVVPKAELATTVWSPDGAGHRVDDHVVEMMMTRLRKRLGPLADAIRAIPRRGYLLDVQLIEQSGGAAPPDQRAM